MAIVIHSKTKTTKVIDLEETDDATSGATTSVVDASWETIDPNPNIHSLFLQFNKEFFFGRLAQCEVRWSPRMTLCAGMCHYEGRGGLCSVRLSQPLLKFRPRKDLVETLLHEMIHAYLFVTDNNKDHDGHGPEFHKHMHRINGNAGTSITVYHSFHAEVASYQQHWWRCEGSKETESASSSSSTQKNAKAIASSEISDKKPAKTLEDYFSKLSGNGYLVGGANSKSAVNVITIDSGPGNKPNFVSCPICQLRLPENEINRHLDSCVSI